MAISHSIILGIIQGIIEFLPISSSGHLIILPWLFSWEKHPLILDVILHLGTFCAILIYFRGEWVNILREGFLSIKQKTLNGPVDRKLFWYIIIASIPAVIFGSMVGGKAEDCLWNPMLAAIALGIFGLVLYIAELYGRKNKSLKDITWRLSLLIGISQALAIIPGVSRSGVTISAAMLLGMNRESSVRFSFLLGAPIIFAAVCYTMSESLFLPLVQSINGGASLGAGIYSGLTYSVFLTGFLIAFASSMLAIHLLLKFVKKYSLTSFAVYRLAFSAVIIIIFFWKG